jgi:hypothetical protein
VSDFGTIVLVVEVIVELCSGYCDCMLVVLLPFGEICVCSLYWELWHVVAQRLVVVMGYIKVVVQSFIGKHAFCCVA